MIEENIILKTDSYKVSHWRQYPKGITHQYSYFESRGGEYPDVLFFGLQYYLKRYLIGSVVTQEKIEDADKLFRAHFGQDIFNREGWEYILKKHDGRLPIVIKAVAEGTIVPTKNVLFTVENTDPKCFWLTSYLETLLEKTWYACTVATKSHNQKQVIKKFLELSGNDIPDFKLHDFGYRGSTSEESAGIGGLAHLISFKGTDTLEAITFAQKYYNQKDMPAFSIPAAEHSTITSWGKDHEKEAYENMLDQFPKGLVAVVSDSYDIFNAVQNIWGKELRDKVEKREGVLVIRPDSGDPNKVVPEVLALLGARFGYTKNEKGYKVLPAYLRLIQGDGIDYEALPSVLEAIVADGWSTDNIAFGSGGGLLQKVNRDTLRFAYKCSNVTINGEDHGVSKNPVTDTTKKSKEGKLALIRLNKEKLGDGLAGWATVHEKYVEEAQPDELQEVFRDGELLIDQNFEDIRKRAEG